MCLDIDSVGNVFVAERDSNRIEKFTPNGNSLLTFSVTQPFGIALDSSNRVYVTSFTTHRVYVFDSNGNFLFKFGSRGIVNGQFISLTSIAVNNTGHIYVDDTTNSGSQRVQVFSPVVSTLSENQVLGQVTVLGTCGLAFASGAPINYGSLLPNATSAEKILALDNTGNVNGIVKVKGGDWKDPSSITRMHVNTTKISNSTSTYAAKSILKFTDQSFGTVTPAVNKTTFWQLQVKLISSNFTGSLTQTMNFTVTC